MNDDDLTVLLTRSAPASVAKRPAVEAELHNVTESVRRQTVQRRRRRAALGVLIPALLAPVAAIGLTAGVETRAIPDYSVPIEFTTLTGERIECSIDYFNGEIAWVEANSNAVDFLKQQNWDNIGQRIYDRAAARIAANDWDVIEDGVTISGDVPDPEMQWSVAWALAEGEFTVWPMPEDLLLPAGLGSNNDCQEQLP